MELLRLARDLLRLFSNRERTRLAVMIAAMALGAIFEAIGIGLIMPFIAILGDPRLIHDHALLNGIYVWVGARNQDQFLLLIACVLFFVYLAKSLYLGWIALLQGTFIYAKQAALSRHLLHHYLQQAYPFYLARNSAELQRNVVNEVSNIAAGIMLPMLLAISELLVLLFIVGLLLAVDPPVTLVTISIVGGVATLIQYLMKSVLSRYSSARSHYAAEMIKWVNQAIGSIKETKVLGREAFFVSAFDVNIRGYAKSSRVFSVTSILPRLLIEVLVMGGLLSTVIFFLATGRDLQLALPLLALFGMAAIRVMPSLTRIMAALTSIRFNQAAIKAVSLDELAAPSSAALPPDRNAMASRAGTKERFESLRFQDVCYRYPQAVELALSSVSLKISRGERIGIVGPTGAGKSTLIDVMLGLLDPQEGAVWIGGARLETVRHRWQSTVGYVPQTIYLLDDSVRCNVALGLDDKDIDDAAVWHALALARIEKKIGSLPEGLDTSLGERGIRLSGGERQRIAIARALLHKPEVLVFDEATSALDNRTEREIAETIHALGGERTVITIAHRMATVMLSDHIYFMDRGRIADSGTYDELLTRSAEFRRMAEATA